MLVPSQTSDWASNFFLKTHMSSRRALNVLGLGGAGSSLPNWSTIRGCCRIDGNGSLSRPGARLSSHDRRHRILSGADDTPGNRALCRDIPDFLIKISHPAPGVQGLAH